MTDRPAAGRPATPARAAAALILLGAIVAGCDAGPLGSPGVGSPEPASASPGASVTDAVPTAPAPLRADPSLLAILPAQVDGVPVTPSPDAVARMVGDPGLATTASAIAVGAAIAPGGSKGGNLAVATVIRLRPGVWNDGFYADWQRAYDEAACEPAAGVASHVEQVIGAHRVAVTTCRGGAKTYHVHPRDDLLISVTAAGERRYGDLMLAGLRE